MKKTFFIIFLLFQNLLFAENIKPVMIYDSELILDKSWNESIHNGLSKFTNKMNIEVKEVSIVKLEEFEKKVLHYAKEGYNPILINYLDQPKQTIIKKLMLKYPKKRFIIFNGTFNIPNAQYYIFSSQESSFLAGYLAAKKSETNKLGFIGGMDIPVIRNFLCGYTKGAKYANPSVEIVVEFIADNLSAWSSPDKAYTMATKQIENGVDIIFAPAGGSSLGVLKAASDKKKFSIGVDSNQNYLYPGSVLTSVVVRVDNASYRALMVAHRNIWREQIKIMGLQEKGVELAFDKYNAKLISNSLRDELAQLKADIILKKINLENYIFSKECALNDKKIF